METLKRRLRNFRHNAVIHPLVGFCYLFGCVGLGDWLHERY